MTEYRPEGLREAGSCGPGRVPRTNGTAALGARGWARWAWRQLTSMRVALQLLLLLAVLALPGGFFPQRSVNPDLVSRYYEENPALAPWLDRLSMFDVFASPWFSAVYLLLFTSLIGCIIPRSISHLRNLRTDPVREPARFSRFSVRSKRTVSSAPSRTQQVLHAALGRRYRIRAQQKRPTGPGGEIARTISAENGYGRETGNLVFHLALVGLLVVTAWGQLVHYRGQALIVEGQTFVNSALDYDSFDAGALFDADDVRPYRIRLDQFVPSFTADAQARDFIAHVTLTLPGEQPSEETVRVNHPLSAMGSKVYLMGNGFAPEITVTDSSGETVASGPVPFLPADNDPYYASTGVVHAPDANEGESQYGFRGSLLPTAIQDEEGTFRGSSYPLPLDPVLVLEMYTGDLGLDAGIPRSMFVLDTTALEQVTQVGDDGQERPVQLVLRPGETVELPGELGTLKFDSLPRFIAVDLRHDPSPVWMGIFAGLAFAGLTAGLFLPRRRLWIRITPGEGGGAVVHAAALARHTDPGLRRELDRVLRSLAEIKEKK